MHGYILADWGSYFMASNTEGYSDPGEIQVQAMATIGECDGVNVRENTLVGPFVTNWNGSSQDEVIESSMTGSIRQAAGVGQIGAYSWGQGQVTANDGRVFTLPTYYHLLVTTTDGMYVGGNLARSTQSTISPEWIPGSNNFTGADGEDGTTVIGSFSFVRT